MIKKVVNPKGFYKNVVAWYKNGESVMGISKQRKGEYKGYWYVWSPYLIINKYFPKKQIAEKVALKEIRNLEISGRI